MKSFDEFISTLNPSELTEVSAKAAASQQDAIAGISQSATAVTIELLRRYHEWLTEQLTESLCK